MPIKCTYKDCSKQFSGEKQMKRHKENDHEGYCKRCDRDYSDDLLLMIHQIESSRHISCPLCGCQFGSLGGRDDHVEQAHRMDQNVICQGCNLKLKNASSLMRHIEKNECRTIKMDDVKKSIAGKAIEKDAWKSGNDTWSHAGSSLSCASDSTSNGGVSLLDTAPINIRGGLPGGSYPVCGPALQPTTNLPYRAPKPPIESSTHKLSLDKFPPLDSKHNAKQQKQLEETSDLMNMYDDEPQQFASKDPNSPWESGQNRDWADPANDPIDNGWGHEPVDTQYQDDSSRLYARTKGSTVTDATYGSKSSFPISQNNTWDNGNTSEAWRNPSSAISAAAQPVNNDPNAEHQRISSVSPQLSRLSISSTNLERYFNHNSSSWDCPGFNCGESFSSRHAFSEHLLSGVHTPVMVTCPSCLKKFRGTAALVAHCESASKRCNIRYAHDYDKVIRHITGGVIATDGWMIDGSRKYVAASIDQW